MRDHRRPGDPLWHAPISRSASSRIACDLAGAPRAAARRAPGPGLSLTQEDRLLLMSMPGGLRPRGSTTWQSPDHTRSPLLAMPMICQSYVAGSVNLITALRMITADPVPAACIVRPKTLLVFPERWLPPSGAGDPGLSLPPASWSARRFTALCFGLAGASQTDWSTGIFEAGVAVRSGAACEEAMAHIAS